MGEKDDSSRRGWPGGPAQVFLKHGAQDKADDQGGAGQFEILEEQTDQPKPSTHCMSKIRLLLE